MSKTPFIIKLIGVLALFSAVVNLFTLTWCQDRVFYGRVLITSILIFVIMIVTDKFYNSKTPKQ